MRIAHISDLHFCTSDAIKEAGTWRRKLGDAVVKAGLGINIEHHPHSDEKKSALSAALRNLSPDVIVVTGDLTNYGDEKSFIQCAKYLNELRGYTKNGHLVVIPGNHDTLTEHYNSLIRKGGLAGFSTRLMGRNIGPVGAAGMNPSQGTDHLATYNKLVSQLGLQHADPASPVEIACEWGELQFFLFDSTNESAGTFMVNRGGIGHGKLAALNSAPLRDDAVKIALLHHHPICSPSLRSGTVDRMFDWMEDGPMFVRFLNQRRFQLALHGHQHDPFHCHINYSHEADDGVHIVAAGSALSGGEGGSSFNVIDLPSPMEARLRLYAYDGAAFQPPQPKPKNLTLSRMPWLRSITAGGEGSFSAEMARRMVRGSDDDRVLEREVLHKYDELSYEVDIVQDDDGKLLYYGRYRRIGVNIGDRQSPGPVFVITGSPGERYEDLQLAASALGPDGKPLGTKLNIIERRDMQFAVQVEMRPLLDPGERFDVTLTFNWKTVLRQDDAFDAISLVGFRQPIGKLKFRLTAPWDLARARVKHVFSKSDLSLNPRTGAIPGDTDRYFFQFEIANPRRTAYQLDFSSQPPTGGSVKPKIQRGPKRRR